MSEKDEAYIKRIYFLFILVLICQGDGEDNYSFDDGVKVLNISLNGRWYLTSEGLNCTSCPPGLFLESRCRKPEGTSRCVMCPPNKYNDNWAANAFCWNCSTTCLRMNEEKAEDCTHDRNIICKCKPGTYLRNLKDNVCLQHTKCEESGLVTKTAGTSERNSICEHPLTTSTQYHPLKHNATGNESSRTSQTSRPATTKEGTENVTTPKVEPVSFKVAFAVVMVLLVLACIAIPLIALITKKFYLGYQADGGSYRRDRKIDLKSIFHTVSENLGNNYKMVLRLLPMPPGKEILESKFDAIEKKEPGNLAEQIYQVLVLWHQMYPQGSVEDVCHALQKEGRNDIVERIQALGIDNDSVV